MPDYPKEQLRQLYKSLPKNLQKALFSQKIADNTDEICKKYGVTNEESIYDTIKNIGYVLLGLLPPNEFQWVLEDELNLEKNVANLISKEITRFVFLPLKKTLEKLYETKINVEELTEEAPSPPLEKETPKQEDIYREPIE